MIKRLLLVIILFSVSLPVWAQMKMPPAVVTAVKAKSAQYQPQVTSVGTLVAREGITVTPDISGRITKIFFTSGELVKANQPLAQIYPDVLQAQLRANQAALELSELNYKRFKHLIKQKAVSTSDFDKAASQLKSDQAAVEKTKAQLEQTMIKAPFTGLLGIRQISLGDFVSPGTPIANLQDVDPIYADFNIPEKYAHQVKVGEKVVVTSAANGQKSYNGSVIARDSRIDPQTRTLKIRASIPNPDNILIPGSFVEVKLNLENSKAVVSIPQTAIVYAPGNNYVYLVVQNKAVKTNVELGERDNKNIMITKGLTPGDLVVSAGTIKLYNGSPVIIAPADQNLKPRKS